MGRIGGVGWRGWGYRGRWGGEGWKGWAKGVGGEVRVGEAGGGCGEEGWRGWAKGVGGEVQDVKKQHQSVSDS